MDTLSDTSEKEKRETHIEVALFSFLVPRDMRLKKRSVVKWFVLLAGLLYTRKNILSRDGISSGVWIS